MKYSVALLAGLALLPMAQAQTPRTPPSPEQIAQREVQHYTTLLSLNPEQEQAATTIFTDEATAQAGERGREHAARQALDQAITGNDTNAIQAAANTIGQLSGEMTSIRALAEAKFYGILMNDQKSKFSELKKGHMWGGRGRSLSPGE